MTTQNLANKGSGNGLLPDGIEPMLISHQKGPVVLTWEQFQGPYTKYHYNVF